MVKEGQLIATSSGQPVKFMGNSTIIVQLIKASKDEGQFYSLSTKDFKP